MRKITQKEGFLTGLLLRFRNFVSIPEVQIIMPIVYQVYLLLCLTIGFRFRMESLYLGGMYLAMDVIMAVLILIPALSVNGQILCAVNLLLSTGLSAQSVFVDRFPITSGTTVSENMFTLVKHLLIGAVAGLACWFVCRVAKNILEKVRLADREGGGEGIVLICNLLCIAIAVLSLGILAMDSLWLAGGGQPSELLKFAFLFYVAFVAGVENKKVTYRKKVMLQGIAYLFVVLAYAGQSEFGSLLIVSLVFVLFLIISNKNWIATLMILGALVVVCAVACTVVIRVGNIYITEKYGEQTYIVDEETGEEVIDTSDNKLYKREFPGVVQKFADLFTSNYEKIYMRFMVTQDIDGTDPDTLPGVRDALREYYSGQARAAFQAIGISRFVPTNAPIFKYVPVGMSDYVYTSVLQSGGLVSVIVMLFAFVLLADSAFALVCRNCGLFNRYLVFVMVTVLQMQLFINVLGVNNVLPLTGITLPFVSTGGSSVLVCTMMVATVFFADMDYVERKRSLVTQWEENPGKGGLEVYDEEQFIVSE